MLDCPARQAQVDKLPAGEDDVLPVGQCSDLRLYSMDTFFPRYIRGFSGFIRHTPSVPKNL